MFDPPNVSCVTCHMSHVTCHMSCVTYHNFFYIIFQTKWWSLLVEGLLPTGPTLSFFIYECYMIDMCFVCDWYVFDMWLIWVCYVGALCLICSLYEIAIQLVCGLYVMDRWLICDCLVVALWLLYSFYVHVKRLLCGCCSSAHRYIFWVISPTMWFQWDCTLVVM